MSIKNEKERKITERALATVIRVQRECKDEKEIAILQETIDKLNQELLDYALQLN